MYISDEATLSMVKAQKIIISTIVNFCLCYHFDKNSRKGYTTNL